MERLWHRQYLTDIFPVMGSWRRIVAAISVSSLVIAVAVVLWRPAHTKDWNQTAVNATFLGMSVGTEPFRPEKKEMPDRFFLPDEMNFSYQVRNTTDEGYLVETTDKKFLVAHTENPTDVQYAPQHVTFESPLYLPPRSSGQITLKVSYPDELLEQLDGFVLFDEENHYLVNFSRGW